MLTVDAGGTEGCASLRLQSGAELEDPLGLARLFIAQDGSYQSYDLAEVSRDNSLSERDVRVANRIIARMGPDAVGAILSRAPAASAVLSKIPAGASLIDQDADIPWQQLEDLFRAFENLPGVGLPRLTKVLHKKRPALVPILDSVVDRYLVAVGGPIAGALGARGTALTRVYKEELDFCLPVLACVREALLADGVDLTECRLLDIYLWAYSGQYDPLWRRAASTPTSQPAHAPDAAYAAREAKVTDDIEVFRDAEAGYLTWIARHPAGWIVNCTRSLTPSYLILHRADCWTIGARGPGNFTTRDYVKVCSLDRSALNTWAAGSGQGGASFPLDLLVKQEDASPSLWGVGRRRVSLRLGDRTP